MKCGKCGVWTTVASTRKLDDWTVRRTRRCGNGHVTTTFEVTSAVWGSIKAVNKTASGAAQRRTDRAVRDRRIVADLAAGLTGLEAAAKYQLTPSSISLIKLRNHPS